MGYAEQTAEAESQEQIKKERDELKNLLSEINRFVMPGECDSVDGMRKIHRERDELKAENERLKLVNKEIASAGKDGDICPACGSAFEQGAFQECGGSIIKENQKLRERVATYEGALRDCRDLVHCAAKAGTFESVEWKISERVSKALAQDDKDAERGSG